jgi:hypothetical protein
LDNTTLNVGTLGDTYRSKDRAGVKTQLIGIDLTPGSGSETLMAGAMPVTGTFWQATQPVSIAAAIAATQSGTWSVRSLDGAGNALTSAARGSERALSVQVVDASGNQVTSFGGTGGGTVTANAGTDLNTSLLALEAGGHLAGIDAKVPALGPALAAASVPVVLTAAQLSTLTPLSTVAVTGTFWQATQPVSLASSVTIVGTGTFAVQAAQSGTWTVTGAGGTFPATQSGTWNIGTVTTLTGITNVVHVDDNSGSLTVDNSGTFATQATQAGTWNVGTVTTVTTVAAVTAITNALPAGTNLIGQVSASDETGTVYSGTTALTPKFATFSTSSSGATTVVALVSSKRIRVLRWRCSANGTTNVKWQSHVTPTDISGLSYLTQFKDAGGGYCPVGHFQTVSGEALDINNSLAIAISGEVTYVEV